VADAYEIETVVRRPLSTTQWLVAPLIAMGALAFAVNTLWGAAVATVVGLGVWLSVARASPHVRVIASRDGLRVGSRSIPRSAFDVALLRHAGGRTYVALRGRRALDVEVPNNVEADALVRALGLDAASSTVEFALGESPSARDWLLVVGLVALTVASFTFAPTPELEAAGAFTGIALVAVASWLTSRVFLRVGADGLLVRRPLGRARFLPHGAIANVRCDGDTIVVEPMTGVALVLRVPGIPTGGDDDRARRRQEDRRADDARAIARRIHQARNAFRDHRAGAGAMVAVLERGARSTREWLEHLRGLGEGAASTFRAMDATRAQLLAVVESTTARARDRLAALVALRAQLTDEEAPRIRVAAERCAEPDLRERMVRVLDAEEDATLEETLGETLEESETA